MGPALLHALAVGRRRQLGTADVTSAWDFQYVIPGNEVNKEYSFCARLAYRPRYRRDEVLREVETWQQLGRESGSHG
jgi:hypothetical protein